ncbi:MAG: hypothetical protein ACTH58_00705 [Marinomonas foliarum]|uniref:hypothetical protein n=1 Tax=Marinomonas foliarum TaxID=491950 RepID=UPI000DF4A096|nr:hypothetical protein [Marinomonas foliarum]
MVNGIVHPRICSLDVFKAIECDVFNLCCRVAILESTGFRLAKPVEFDWFKLRSYWAAVADHGRAFLMLPYGLVVWRL